VSITEASFCGIIFSIDDLINITDPLSELLSFGWTTHRYAKSKPSLRKMLLRCKSMSLAFQYPGCPILSSLAQYGLRVTSSYNVKRYITNSRNMSEWDREQYLQSLAFGRAPVVPPGMSSRLLMERKFGISVEDQLSIEKYLDGLRSISPLTHPMIVYYSSPTQRDYYAKYYTEYYSDEDETSPYVYFYNISSLAREWT